MVDKSAAPRDLLQLGRIRELTGDTIGAVVVYRQVVLAGEAASRAEAQRRLEALMARWTGRPA
jgi:hypothetical protein